MISDRHAEPEACVYSTEEFAIEAAKSWINQLKHDQCDIEEKELEGWLYYAKYCGEGDSVWVVEKELDPT